MVSTDCLHCRLIAASAAHPTISSNIQPVLLLVGSGRTRCNTSSSAP